MSGERQSPADSGSAAADPPACSSMRPHPLPFLMCGELPTRARAVTRRRTAAAHLLHGREPTGGELPRLRPPHHQRVCLELLPNASGHAGSSSPSRRSSDRRSARPPSPPRRPFLLAPRPSSPHAGVAELERIHRQSLSLAPAPPSSRDRDAPQLRPPQVMRQSTRRPPPQLTSPAPALLPPASRKTGHDDPASCFAGDRETPRRAMARRPRPRLKQLRRRPCSGTGGLMVPDLAWVVSSSTLLLRSHKENGEHMVGPAKHGDACCRESPALQPVRLAGG
jgi:hypothetical protein